MTSFRKRTVQKPIRGTRTSPHTAQVITSSGNPSLDVILGGGLPIGSICLIEEDRFMTHAKVLAKYFLAEGVLSKQEIFLGSLDDLPAEMLRRLPKPLTDEEVELEQRQEQLASEQPADKNGLRIAFRYGDLPLVNSEQAGHKIGHHFNLMEHMDSMMLYYAQTTVWDDSYKEHDIVVQEDNISNSSNSLDQTATIVADASPAAVDATPPPAAAGENASTVAVDVEIEADAESTAVISSSNNNNNNNDNNTASTTPGTTIAMPATQPPPPPPPPAAAVAPPTAVAPPPPAPSAMEPHFFYNPRYGRLLNDVQQLLRDESFVPGTNTQQKNLCRVCLTSLGSPLWYDDHFAGDLLKFLTILRASVRSCTAVCFITMPMHLIAKYDTSLVPKIRQLVDYSIELESFAGSERETHPAFKEYSGLLHLHKMSALNTLAVHMPETTDLAFKLRRKKFVIEKLHLPPELQETSEKSAAADIMATPNCGSIVSGNSNVSMDF
ncbi:putative elongator complex protein 4 [Drosophila grimshawi]|uniref:Elongator complex protein 4 n=1 Tax=Drosophila grimshawi TaxID=7222 RepID=B4JVI4_DROGR|nr:putative elongator complex protein 4 [Drosophila grimshawi]EDV98452.1 GH22667 [Drosophila grimshawi]